MMPMRQTAGGEITTSVLGFGCGSVLGRVGRGASLRAMNTAWDLGITLFDTARSYGFGDAEAVLGEFLRGKREQAVIATKFGLAPQRQSALKRAALPMVRAALKVPGVRGLLHSGGSDKKTFGEFTVTGLRTSLEESLRQLRTDRIDVLFLHEATTAVIQQQDLMAELDAVVQAGKVLRVGLYADAEVVGEGIANGPSMLTAMQFGANAFDPVVAGFTTHNPCGMLLIANHPFGGTQRVELTQALLAAMASDETVPAELREKLRNADWQAMTEAIFGMVLDGAKTHALVLSMMDAGHLRANARAVEQNRFTAAELTLMRARMVGAASATSGV
jgi:aryl-alcohol dehydrogenase-like predicted oxidoreductase